jgi:hypothetical protein
VVSEGAEQDVQGEAPDERDGTLPIQTHELEGEDTLPLQAVLDMLVHASRSWTSIFHWLGSSSIPATTLCSSSRGMS